MDRNRRVRIDTRLKRIRRLLESAYQDAQWRYNEYEKAIERGERTQPEDANTGTQTSSEAP